MKDIALYIGPRGCGKSLYAENELSAYGSKLYIGTLPVTQRYMKTIDDHRQRRGKDWATFEVGSALDQDIDEIKVWISAAQGLEACLLDGMITWFIHLKEAGHPATADHFAQRIVEVVSVRDLVWRLVDVDPEIFKAISPEWELYREILDYIITTLKITKIKNWNYE